MKKSNMKMGLIVGGCTAALAVGGALAFLTDTATVTNRFNIVDALEIEVTEPGWEELPDTDDNGIPDVAEETTPGETFTKDPQVTNTAGTEAWIFARVDVPRAEVAVVDEDGTVQPAAETPLFSFDVNAEWTAMGDPVVSADGDTISYWFKRTGKLAVGATTGAIFDDVTYANVVEGEIGSNQEMDVVVTAYAIQTEGFDTADDAWTAYTEQNKDGVLDGVQLPTVQSMNSLELGDGTETTEDETETADETVDETVDETEVVENVDDEEAPRI